MNWKRGLHRMYYVACAVWVLYCLVWWPVHQQVEFADVYHNQHRMQADLCLQSGLPQSEAQACWERTTQEDIRGPGLQLMLWQWGWKGWGIALLAIVIPCAAMYALARFAIWLVMWLRKGFAPVPSKP